jgi:two-component system sensor histidine kinase FlrB
MELADHPGMQSVASQSVESSRADLTEAFLAFGSVSARLTESFDSLRDEVARLRVRLAGVLGALPGGVLVLDPEGRIQHANPAAAVQLGEPLTDMPFDAVLVRAGGAGARRGEHLDLANGRCISLSRRELEGGGHVVLVTDVTEAQAMQAMLARQQRLLTLGELAAGLAHQIRTPLAAALLYSSQMTLAVRTPADLARCADKTVESLRQLDRLVNDMLAFAHGGAARERVSVSALLEQVAQWLRPALREGVQLTIRTEAPQLAVLANAPSLVSVLLNLATNALQASSGPLRLELLARQAAAGRAQIVISDDGPGVPEALRARIFEPFFTTRERGHGIGLAIVRSVVEAHGGSVSLAPSTRGATFIVEIPAEATS